MTLIASATFEIDSFSGTDTLGVTFYLQREDLAVWDNNWPFAVRRATAKLLAAVEERMKGTAL